MRANRITVGALLLLLLVGLGVVPAAAEPVLVSELTFSPGNPTFDPYGSGTTIIGAATVTAGGWLDFSGRGVVETRDRPSLNPGVSDFSFGARFAFTRGVADANLMQKGFFNDHQWKLSVHAKNGAAQFSCRISGSSGVVHVYTNGPVVTPGPAWHQVACKRTGNQVQVVLDGAVIATGSGPIGTVSSSKPYLIGSKGAGQMSDPDQYRGLVDDAFVEVDTASTGQPPTPPPSPPQSPPPSPPQSETVTATVETVPVSHSGDAADDPAIWPHPTDPSRSVVIGNDKGGSLDVYDMQGQLVQRINEGFFGNVDLRTAVTIGSSTRDVVAVWRAGLRLYGIDQNTRLLSNITDSGTGSIAGPTAGEGLCMYRSSVSGDTYAFVLTRTGQVTQYRLTDADGDSMIDAQQVRTWAVGSEAESCVADDEHGALYISEEDVAVWRYGAEPTAGTGASDRTAIDRVTTAGGRLAADIEGLSIVRTGGGQGFLLASAQAASDTANFYAVYDRTGSNAFVKTFSVVAGSETDNCGRTDGIETYAGDLGPGFPQGMFVCQDNTNTAPNPGNQNFKYVPLERVVPLAGGDGDGDGGGGDGDGDGSGGDGDGDGSGGDGDGSGGEGDGGEGEPANSPPVAALDLTGCTGLTCTFDASASHDPDGGAMTFSWDFGDGGTAQDALVEHTFIAAGSYEVAVEVVDDLGAASSATRTVDVQDASTAAISYRASAAKAVNASSVTVSVPTSVQSGDTLLLSAAGNRSDVTLSAPAGWTSLGLQADESMQSRVWFKSARAGDAGSSVRVTATATTKMTVEVLAYAGLDPTSPNVRAASTNQPVSTVNHTSPVVTTAPQSWVVSYWANKSSETTGWTTPATLVRRQQQVVSGSGRVTSVIGDTGAPVAANSYGGLVAAASQASNKATMWSIVLTP